MECHLRKPVACGSVIRLQHLQTHLFLHSHNFRSPLSSNQEVSCFGDGSKGDEGTTVIGVMVGGVMMVGAWTSG